MLPHSVARVLRRAPQAPRLCRGLATPSDAGLLEYEEAACDSGNRANEATGVVLHGLLGSGRNWRSFSRALAADLAAASGRPWRLWLVDQRCHGQSLRKAGLGGPHTVHASAADLGRLLDASLPGAQLDALIGHSLGGKVVLDLLQQRRSAPPAQQVWLLDSVVGEAQSGSEEPSDVRRVLEEAARIPLPIPSRDWLYQHLESRGFSSGFRLWMGSNLATHQGGKYGWTFDVAGARQLYASYQRSGYWPLVEAPPAGVSLHLVRAARSDRWSEAHWRRLQRAEAGSQGRLKLHVLPDAGHWLHADNPEGLRQLLAAGIAAAV